MENGSLLDRARATRGKASSKNASQEEEDLAIAWLKGEVTMAQAAGALQLSGATAAAYAIVQFLRSAYSHGRIQEVVNPKQEEKQ